MARTLTEDDIDAIADRVVSKLAQKLAMPVAGRPTERSEGPTSQPQKLVYTKKELLGALAVSETTLWRWEARGLINSMPGIRHKHYARAEVERFLARGNKSSQ